MDALQVGPFALPWARVQVALALLLLVGVAEVLARRVDKRLSPWARVPFWWGFWGRGLVSFWKMLPFTPGTPFRSSTSGKGGLTPGGVFWQEGGIRS